MNYAEMCKMALESTKPNPERDSAEMERRHNCNNALELARSKLESDIIDFYADGQPHKLILTSDSY
jgi:hypothetical protein